MTTVPSPPRRCPGSHPFRAVSGGERVGTVVNQFRTVVDQFHTVVDQFRTVVDQARELATERVETR